MPLLDSFKVDHTKMTAPGVRLAKTMKSKKGDVISVFDLRFCLLFHINQFKGLSIIFKTFFFIKNVTVSWICWLSDETWLVWHNAPKVKTPCPFKSMIKS